MRDAPPPQAAAEPDTWAPRLWLCLRVARKLAILTAPHMRPATTGTGLLPSPARVQRSNQTKPYAGSSDLLAS